MKAKQQISTLWESLRDAIDAAYSSRMKANTGADVLRDYARDQTWNDALANLLETETTNEKQHRSNRPGPKDFPAMSAAKLILCNNVAVGSQLSACPPATDFLRYRKTAVEAQVIGWLIREQITDEWRAQVAALDYARLMQEVSK